MIIGLGLDLVEIPRIDQSINRFGDRFLARIFTMAERSYCDSKASPGTHYAARFAAKEACAKALGMGVSQGIRFTDMEVTRDETGKPTMLLTGYAREIAAQLAVVTIHVSLSHTALQATAVVILED